MQPETPRSLAACLPFLWSRVLFPGRPCGATAWRRGALLLLIVLPAVLLYPCMSFYLFEPDEGRYAEIPREMLARGDWVVPHLHGEPYLDKPPLLYWLVMLSYSVFGVHDWAARVVPGLAVHAVVLLTYLLGRRSLGERPAFLGALLLCLAPGLFGMGRLLILDGVLALWVTLALLSAFEAVCGPELRRGWWLASATACGLALLTKGPIVFILVLVPLWLHGRLTGAARIAWRDRLAFLGLALAVAAPWYVLMCLRVPEFARYFLWEHNVVRFADPFDHQEPVWFYGPLLLWALLPGTLLLVPFLRFLGSGEPDVAARRTPALGFVLLAGVWCVLFFSLSGCKLPTYILPALPPLALAVGFFLAQAPRPRPRLVGGLLGAALVVQALTHYVIVPWYANYRSPLQHWVEVERLCADPETRVVCFPRAAHSVAFYLGREDLPHYRSKEVHLLRKDLFERPRTVVLFTHRHSLEGFRNTLPPGLKMTHACHFGLAPLEWLPAPLRPRATQALGKTALGLCDLAVIEPRGPVAASR